MDFLGSFSDGAMSQPALAGVLAVLALIDSTSFGTLLIPVWLMLAPGRLRPGRVLVFLGTVAGFYLAVGIAVMLGADAFLGAFGDLLSGRPAAILMMVVGIGLVLLSFALDSPAAKRRAAEQAEHGGGRIGRWRERAMGVESDDNAARGGGVGSAVNGRLSTGSVSWSESALPTSTTTRGRGSVGALMGLALAAAAIEVASMLPYLAGIGLISTQGPGWPTSVLWLAAYCLVMITPALVLLTGRLVAARQLDGPLRRLDSWLTRNAASTTAWVVGIVGVVLALNGLQQFQG
ncbi:GAP family protein [Georgenia sp. Z1344]|uniref:GAP family protein n=1 Tax=Georgenia sp. Z1344 TaxID=3416706 RepID=UPI003CE6FD49